MARIARVVATGCWHHITQRGNRRQTVFFDDADRSMYLQLLRRHSRQEGVKITGYWLMGNHVHLIAVPAGETGLSRALGRTHGDYARWLNLRRGEVGHVWQNRFYSCTLDEAHRWEALRYVELNPVRARMVERAVDWPWSSAAAHVSGEDAVGILALAGWSGRWSAAAWGQRLEEGIEDALLVQRIRQATQTGRPMAEPGFVLTLESELGRTLRVQKRGPKKKIASEVAQLSFGVS